MATTSSPTPSTAPSSIPDLSAPLLRPAQARELHLRALIADVDEHSWRRRQQLRALRTPADWQQRVRATRAAFTAALGPLPERSPLGVTCTGTLQRDGYVVEKLLVETQPDFYATVNLYLPERQTGPAPAILNAVGHWGFSKSEPVEQARLAGLARKGYVGLIWDPIGQGERSQYLDPQTGQPWTGSAVHQHAAVCNVAFLINSTVIATMLWDGVRMLDYLCSRPEVDPARIGCTGVSGGGTYTMFLGLFDDRIKVSVPVCSTSRYERMNRTGQIGEPCQEPLGSYPADLDIPDLLMAHAPKPLRLIGTRYDFFPLAGLREAYLDVADCYAGLDVAERADLQVVNAHHDYNQEQRELMYAWFNRWLNHDAPVAEDPFTPEAPETLWCTPTGQLLTAGYARTTLDLIRDLTTSVAPPAAPTAAEAHPETSARTAATAQARADAQTVRAAVRDTLGEIPPLTGAPPQTLPASESGGLTVERVVVQARMDMALPLLIFQPASGPQPAVALAPGTAAGPARGPQPAAGLAPDAAASPTPGSATDSQPAAGSAPGARRPVAVLIDDRGKIAESGDGGLLPALARSGVIAVGADLRGWGETAWACEWFGWSQDRRQVISAENMLAYVSGMLGYWHVTQRVQDVTAILRYLRSRDDVDPARISLIGRGGGGVVALHAAAVLDDLPLRGVATYESLASFRSVIDAPWYGASVADFVPGALLHYDLPLVAASLAPARVLIAAPQSATGTALGPEEVGALYGGMQQRAALSGQSLEVISHPSPAEWIDSMVQWVNRTGN